MTAFVFAKSRDGFFDAVVSHLKERHVKVVDHWRSSRPRPNCFTIVLGGDGTVLSAARSCIKNPVLVINTGHLGFLTSSAQDYYTTAIDNFLEGDYTTTARHMLELTVGSRKFTALNDIVIAKDGLSKLVMVALFTVQGISEQFVTDYRADGLIVSTPTGSTAYNLSASGPIIHPNCETFVVTPICPQGLTQRPLVLPAMLNLRIKPLDADLYLSIDGQIGLALKQNTIDVKYNSHKMEIVDPEASYFQILRQKLGWGIKPV